ncbi:MAG: hypothetical protein IPP93_01450 [Chitinophagaceae bacterium]|nr:hypothetical protein [Chitinophagaceae bacterium]MBL0336323.1 hypothetical protein [Chitinophagaceae bacterium]
MHKLFMVAFATFSITWGCTPKAVPVIHDRVVPVAANTGAAPVTIRPDIEKGKILFNNRCGRCHALPDPAAYSETRWNFILERMIPRARMDTAEGVHVKAFILKGIQQ